MIKVSENRINYLKQWRKERRLEREIARNCAAHDEGLPSGMAGGDSIDLEVKDFSREVCAGDVRVLSDDLTSHAAGPRYIAVLTSPQRGIAVCAPFSRYSVPATKDEWLTGLMSPSLRVLQLWNAQPCAVGSIAKSWKVLSLDEGKLSRAVELYRHSVRHTFPADNEREDIGVAVVSENDERNDYMADEYSEFSPLFSSVAAMIERMNNLFDRIIGLRVSPVFGREEYALAAADERRNPFAKGSVDGTDALVSVEYETEKRILRVKLRNAGGAYDGWSVLTPDDEALGEIGIIEKGMLVARNVEAAILERGLVFASPDGKTVKPFVPGNVAN